MSQFIHVLNRGVDKRTIFLNDRDRLRFIHNLFEFNDEANATSNYYAFKIRTFARSEIRREPRKLLVNIHAFCLMPNHYHLLLSENIENGIPRFMRKLNMGYALYFNEKYKREGALFQGRYKSVPILNDSHFIHIPYYIHLNPLDLKFPSWRDRELNGSKGAIDYLNTYRWSSHLDYSGIKNFPSVTQRDFLNEYFEDPKNYKKSIASWLKNIDLENMEKLLLE